MDFERAGTELWLRERQGFVEKGCQVCLGDSPCALGTECYAWPLECNNKCSNSDCLPANPVNHCHYKGVYEGLDVCGGYKSWQIPSTEKQMSSAFDDLQ